MSFIYREELSESEKHFLKSKLHKFNEDSQGCHIWYGSCNRDGYAIIRPQFRGKRITLTVHRLVFFFSRNCSFENLDYHVSHKCHVKKCVNVQHLSFEPALINLERTICFLNNVCVGHYGYGKCLLRDR